MRDSPLDRSRVVRQSSDDDSGRLLVFDWLSVGPIAAPGGVGSCKDDLAEFPGCVWSNEA